MVARSLFPFDRTPARTITIVTKGWLRCCSEFHGRMSDFAWLVTGETVRRERRWTSAGASPAQVSMAIGSRRASRR